MLAGAREHDGVATHLAGGASELFDHVVRARAVDGLGLFDLQESHVDVVALGRPADEHLDVLRSDGSERTRRVVDIGGTHERATPERERQRERAGEHEAGPTAKAMASRRGESPGPYDVALEQRCETAAHQRRRAESGEVVDCIGKRSQIYHPFCLSGAVGDARDRSTIPCGCSLQCNPHAGKPANTSGPY
jgi:hypothetical protein